MHCGKSRPPRRHSSLFPAFGTCLNFTGEVKKVKLYFLDWPESQAVFALLCLKKVGIENMEIAELFFCDAHHFQTFVSFVPSDIYIRKICLVSFF